MSYKKPYFNGKVDKLPRVRRIEYRVKYNMTTVAVNWLDGCYTSSSDFTRHSPRTKAMLQSIELVKQEIDFFNGKIIFNKVGKYRWKQMTKRV